MPDPGYRPSGRPPPGAPRPGERTESEDTMTDAGTNANATSQKSQRTVAVAGATGFVGRTVVRELLSRGWAVRVLTRDRAKAARVLPKAGVTVIVGDVLEEASVDSLLTGAAACVNLVGILRESRGEGVASTFERAHTRTTRMLVQRCEAMGVARFVQVSALGVKDDGVSDYQRSKWNAEQAVRKSSLRWTVLRPGLIHGRDSEFIKLAKGWVSGHEAPWLFMPYFAREVEDKRVPLGPVEFVDPKIAPIAVEDVARAIALSLEKDATEGEVYNLVGSQTMTWPQMLRHLRDTLPGGNAGIEPMAVPSTPAAIGAMVAGRVGLGFMLPFDEGMARMGAEDSTASLDKVQSDLGFTPAPFSDSLARYAAAV
ncbi:MAG: NAD-dependent epimerase/dehydratase family protein [Leptolyngbya sp. PLA1]|nr:NAD-dependent epimerase/dehydratase family protein [Leptolyngbya sp. PLA1]